MRSRAAAAAIVAQGGWVHGFDVAGDVVATVADAMDHPARVHAQRGNEAPRRASSASTTSCSTKLPLRPSARKCVLKGARRRAGADVGRLPAGLRSRRRSTRCCTASTAARTRRAGDTFHYRWNNQVFAAQGYVVACVNYHGSSRLRPASSTASPHRWGELELADIEAGTDWLLKQRWADRKRVFATGGSYGGFMVAWMNGHVKPGRYSAYVCHAGCFDWTAMFADDAYTWHRQGARRLRTGTTRRRSRRRARTPSSSAMKTPTLVIHGAHDYRVPDQQGLAYYNTLKAQGRRCPAALVPGREPLGPASRATRRLWYGEFFDWLKRHAAAVEAAAARQGPSAGRANPGPSPGYPSAQFASGMPPC